MHMTEFSIIGSVQHCRRDVADSCEFDSMNSESRSVVHRDADRSFANQRGEFLSIHGMRSRNNGCELGC